MYILFKRYSDETIAQLVAVSEDRDALIDKITTLPGGRYDIAEVEYVSAKEN